MWNALQVTFHFIKCILLYTLGLDRDADSYLAGKSILRNMSYRLEASAAKDSLIGFRVFWRVLKQLFRASIPKVAYNEHCIFDGKVSSSELRSTYVAWQNGANASFISRDRLLFMPARGGSLVLVFFVILFLPIYCLATLFLPSRAKIALLLTEYVELINLSMLLKQGGVKRLFFFSPYEKDANLMALYLMQKGVLVSKHPSPGPLMTHNSIVIADILALSSEYQREEIEGSALQIRAKKIEKWFPENSQKYLPLYAKKDVVSPALTVGFYSHASWLRKKKNHSDDGLNIVAAETLLLTELALFLKEHKNVQLVVFLHPRERHPSVVSQSHHYYADFFSGLTYSISPDTTKTDAAFDTVDVAVAAFSTILYERLFAGFKTLIASYGIAGFPIKDSALSSITVNQKGQLDKKLQEALNSTTPDFFASHRLFGYRYFEYERWQQKTT